MAFSILGSMASSSTNSVALNEIAKDFKQNSLIYSTFFNTMRE